MSYNDDLRKQNSWARCWYTFELTNKGNGNFPREADVIRIAFQAFSEQQCAQVNAGYIKVKRIPSHLQPKVKKAFGKSYRMSEFTYEPGDMTALEQDMNLYEAEWNNVVMGHALKRSDLYYIDGFFVEPEFRGRGLATHMLRTLPKLLRLHMHEQKPVIAVIPYEPDDTTDYNRLVAFLERNNFTFPSGSKHTMIYNLE